MSHTYTNMPRRRVEEPTSPQDTARPIGIPSQAAYSWNLPPSDQASKDRLEKVMKERIQSIRNSQIPAAEQEADRLAAGITNARTPEEVKERLGQQMGADFSHVRFHTDANAIHAAEAMGARAYASGPDIYFGEGGFDPKVAAHELVHTVQQGVVDSGISTTAAPMGSVQMIKKPLKSAWRGIKRLFGFGQREEEGAEPQQEPSLEEQYFPAYRHRDEALQFLQNDDDQRTEATKKHMRARQMNSWRESADPETARAARRMTPNRRFAFLRNKNLRPDGSSDWSETGEPTFETAHQNHAFARYSDLAELDEEHRVADTEYNQKLDSLLTPEGTQWSGNPVKDMATLQYLMSHVQKELGAMDYEGDIGGEGFSQKFQKNFQILNQIEALSSMTNDYADQYNGFEEEDFGPDVDEWEQRSAMTKALLWGDASQNNPMYAKYLNAKDWHSRAATAMGLGLGDLSWAHDVDKNYKRAKGNAEMEESFPAYGRAVAEKREKQAAMDEEEAAAAAADLFREPEPQKPRKKWWQFWKKG